jgi:hypothetical protein
MIAYAFLTKHPNATMIKFAEDLYDKYKNDIYIFVDDNSYDTSKLSQKIKFVQLEQEDCIRNKMWFMQEPIYNKAMYEMQQYEAGNKSQQICMVWDKVSYYFTHLNTTYEHVWFIEYDVFISSVDTLHNIDTRYPTADLVCKENHKYNKAEQEGTWFWDYALHIFGPSKDVYSSNICAVRLSQRLFRLLKEAAYKNGFSPFHEFSYNTIAMHNGLEIKCPEELSTLVWRRDWTIEDFKLQKGHLFHPVKDYENHQIYRDKIQ